ncbi:MAG: hypothetical protein ACRDOK_12460 [Streptosporangiaceae bacterium]
MCLAPARAGHYDPAALDCGSRPARTLGAAPRKRAPCTAFLPTPPNEQTTRSPTATLVTPGPVAWTTLASSRPPTTGTPADFVPGAQVPVGVAPPGGREPGPDLAGTWLIQLALGELPRLARLPDGCCPDPHHDRLTSRPQRTWPTAGAAASVPSG